MTTDPAPSGVTEQARRGGNPVATDGGFTWVWVDDGAPPPALAGDWCSWHPDAGIAWSRPSAGVRTAHLDVEPDAYLEYALFRDGERVRDPLSRARIGNGVGDWNHRAWMPGAPRAADRLKRQRHAPAPPGRLTEHRVEPLGYAASKRRRVWLHRPAGHDPATLPLLVVLDGQDYLRAKMDRVLDLLIHEGRMAPVVTAFVEHGGLDRRMVEYMGSEMTLVWLGDIVVRVSREEAGIADPATGAAGRAAVMGASAGGLMAFLCGMRRPEIFGRVLSQSGAWAFDGRETVAVPLVRGGSAAPIRIWMDAGRYESLFEPNECMAALLEERGWDVTYRRYPAGHNFTAWMEELFVGLPALLPPGDRA